MRFGSVCLERSAVAVAVGALIASAASAQTAEGSIYGRGKPGASVAITSVGSGVARQLTVNDSGTFRAPRLAPGAYQVASGGKTRTVNVEIGSGIEVDFEEAEISRVNVTHQRIDMLSAESPTRFRADRIQALPVARDINAIAALAPGVVKGDPDLGGGGLPSFSGASVAENGYYINGFDVTNIRNFLSYANLPFEAIEAQQIKNGGYGAEYGRSLGGVISIVTKRGSNTWKGGAALDWSPAALKAEGKNLLDLDPDNAKYKVFRQYDRSGELTANVFAGGPIIENKLSVFALLEGRRDTADVFDLNRSVHTRSARPNGLVKLDFTPGGDHRLEFTGISNKKKIDYTDYLNADGAEYAAVHSGTPERGSVESGGHTLIGKYTGNLTDNFVLSALAGAVDDRQPMTSGARVSALSCPTVYDVDSRLLGCWKEPFNPGAARDPAAPPYDIDKRRAFRIDAELALGNHALRAGIDSQKFTSTQAGATYSGDVYWRYLGSDDGTVNGVENAVAPGSSYVRRRLNRSSSGTFQVKNDAWYVEDSWRVTKRLLLYGGLRFESFNNMNGDGDSFVKADRLAAPRLGFAWNMNGDDRTKVYGNAGRYFIPVASNTNIRATRGEMSEDRFYTYDGRDPVTAAPLHLGPEIGNALVIGDGKAKESAKIADIHLKPMSQDEYILGIQHAMPKGWSVGLKGVYRTVRNGMDDYCSHSAFQKWAEDNGHPNFDASTMALCAIVNPGNDVMLQVDLDNNGQLRPVTFPASYIGLAKYKRTYKALELTLERPLDSVWGLNASYTLSATKGTAEGYVNSITNQEDAGVSEDFDFPSLTHGTDGYLANDRRHVLKAYGTYMLNDRMRLGFNATVASGRPISCIGYVPWNAPDYEDAAGYSSASAFYCLNEKGVSELHQRGSFGRTPWTSSLDLSFAWLPKVGNGKLTLQVDVFNVFNQQQVTEVDEQRDFSRSTTSENEGRLNLNWKRPTSFQEPRSVRFTARYEF